MTKRSEIIVLVLWALAIVCVVGGMVHSVMTGEAAWSASGVALGCFMLLQAILVAVVGRE